MIRDHTPHGKAATFTRDPKLTGLCLHNILFVVHMIPAFCGLTKVANERFYFNDLIDYDMFLRAGN